MSKQSWFDALSPKQKIVYLRSHPNSKYGRKKVKNPPVDKSCKQIVKENLKDVKYAHGDDVKKWKIKMQRLKAQCLAAKTDNVKNRLEAQYNIAKRRYENLRSLFK